MRRRVVEARAGAGPPAELWVESSTASSDARLREAVAFADERVRG